MKKIMFVMPLMAVSLLACSKGGGSTPTSKSYTVTFNCTDCKAYDESDNEVKEIQVPVSSYSPHYKFHFKTDNSYKRPFKSLISVKKTDKEETVNFEFDPADCEIDVVVNSDLTISASGFNKTLEECTWAQINEISTTGRADEFFDVGNTKNVTLTYEGKLQKFSHEVRIIGFNQDYSELIDGDNDPDPNKALGITFEFVNVITNSNGEPVTTKWNLSANYDYRSSTLNGFLNDAGDDASVINMLPSSDDPDNPDLRNVIKPVDKKVGVSTDEGQNYTATSFDGETHPYPYLFPLVHDEIHDVAGRAHLTSGEATGIYKYYEDYAGDSKEDREYRMKTAVNGSNSLNYWFRSPATDDNDCAFHVTNIGHIDDEGKTFINDFPISPAFCI